MLHHAMGVGSASVLSLVDLLSIGLSMLLQY